MPDPQPRCFGSTPASKNGSHPQTYLGNGVGTKDARAAAARDELRLGSSTKIARRCRHCVPVQPAKEKDGYTRREFRTGVVSRRGRAGKCQDTPHSLPGTFGRSRREDRNPQSCRTPRWTEVRGKRLPGVVRRSPSQLCRMLVRLASRPRTPLSGPHALRATRMSSVIDAGAEGDLVVPAVLFPQQSGRFVLAYREPRGNAMIESELSVCRGL